MTTDFLTISPEHTAQDVIDMLRERHPSADQVYYLYVTEPDGTLAGTITLRGLIVAQPRTVSDWLTKLNTTVTSTRKQGRADG